MTPRIDDELKKPWGTRRTRPPSPRLRRARPGISEYVREEHAVSPGAPPHASQRVGVGAGMHRRPNEGGVSPRAARTLTVRFSCSRRFPRGDEQPVAVASQDKLENEDKEADDNQQHDGNLKPCLHGVNVYKSVEFAVQPRLR
jgi:hypothetical protein